MCNALAAREWRRCGFQTTTSASAPTRRLPFVGHIQNVRAGASAHNRTQSAVVIRPATTPSDCVWQQSGFPTTTGPDEAVALLESMIESLGLASIDVEYLHIASSEDVVFTERLDWLVQRDGTRMGPAVVVGVTEFRDGKICAWREDMDTSSFAHMLDS